MLPVERLPTSCRVSSKQTNKKYFRFEPKRTETQCFSVVSRSRFASRNQKLKLATCIHVHELLLEVLSECRLFFNSLLYCLIAKFLVPDWGDKVNSGIGLSYRPATARLHRLAGQYNNPMPESTISPGQGL